MDVHSQQSLSAPFHTEAVEMLKALRLRTGLGLRAFAHLAHLDPADVWRTEARRSPPSDRVIERWVHGALGTGESADCTIDEIRMLFGKSPLDMTIGDLKVLAATAQQLKEARTQTMLTVGA